MAYLGRMEVLIRRHQPNSPWRYSDLDRLQREIAAEVRVDGAAGAYEGAPGKILLSEVAPVITLGRRASVAELLESAESLGRRGIDLYQTDRGGLATWHGPGQWVVFVVERLDRLTGDSRGVKKAVETLLEVALEVGREYGLPAEIRQGCELGVWASECSGESSLTRAPESVRVGKFAAVGVHVEQGVLLHGLSINGYATPLSFSGLRPCGLDAPVAYLLEGAREREFLALGERIVARVRDKFALR